MAGFTNYTEQLFMNLLFGAKGSPFTAPATLYFGLHVGATAPDMEAGTGVVEPVAMAYARVALTNNATNFPDATQVAGEAEKHNAAAISFPQATGNWSTAGQPATHWFVADASTGGNILAIGALTTTKVISNGDTASFAASAISMTLD